jgi:UPF0755 protein
LENPVSEVPARKAAVAVHRVLALTAIILALGLAVAVWAVFLRPQVNTEPGKPVQIEVAHGVSTARIAETLARAGVIANPGMMRIRARLADADGRLKPGVYDLRTGMGYASVIEQLVEGPPISYVSVTIPEGFVIAQIAERLEDRAGIPREEFVALADKGAERFVDEHPYLADVYRGSLEGYLFPKTYRIRGGSTAEQVIRMMLRQFDIELGQVDLSAAERRGLSLNDLVTTASIIEREARLDDERPLVSSVIHNRLAKGMRLEIDATVEYVLPGTRFRLRYSDLRVDSPYNTYRNIGLPPGPISSPGLASLQAAALPADTRYVYYVLTGHDGSHTFTTNKRDFLKAKQRSKEVFGR